MSTSFRRLVWPAANPEDLRRHAGLLVSFGAHATESIHEWVATSHPTAWSGRARSGHDERLARVGERGSMLELPLREAATLLEQLAQAVEAARDELGALERAIQDAERAASDAQRLADAAQRETAEQISALFRVESAGTFAHQRRVVADETLTRATIRAETLGAELNALDVASATTIDQLLIGLRAAHTEPASNTDWDAVSATIAEFDTLDQRSRLIEGNGASHFSPIYEATRKEIHGYIESLEVAVATIEQVPAMFRSWSEWLALRHLRTEIATHERFLSKDRRILEWNPDGDGRVVEVFGDLSTAKHIAVMVPGIMTTLRNFDSMHGARSEELWRATAHHSPDVAVVAWLGYDAPEILNAVSPERAEAQATDLVGFVGGLPSTAHVSVVAHSYGTVLAGAAARKGLDASDLVLVGSPGTSLGAASDARLLDGGSVWAAVSDTDPVGKVGFGSALCPETVLDVEWLSALRWIVNPAGIPGSWLTDSCRTDSDGDVRGLTHGLNPAHEDFGASEIESTGVQGHSEYFEPSSSTLTSIALIVAGVNRKED